MRWSSKATWTSSRSRRPASATRSRRSARPAPPSMCKSWSASPTRSCSASTATPPAAARPAAALEASLPHASDTRSFRFLFLPPEHDPDTFVRERGAAAFEQAIAEAVPLSRQVVALAGEDVDLATAEGGRASSPTRGRCGRPCPTACSSASCSARSRRAAHCRCRPARRGRWGHGAPARRRARDGARGGATRLAAAAARPGQGEPARPRRLDAAAREPLVGDPERRRPCPALRPARLARRAVPLSRPRGHRARRLSRGRLLRERMTVEPWADAALALVDAEDPAIEPLADDLPRSIDQLRQAACERASDARRVHRPHLSVCQSQRRESRYNPRVFDERAASVTAAPPGPGHPLTQGQISREFRPPLPARAATSDDHQELARTDASPSTGWPLGTFDPLNRCAAVRLCFCIERADLELRRLRSSMTGAATCQPHHHPRICMTREEKRPRPGHKAASHGRQGRQGR